MNVAQKTAIGSVAIGLLVLGLKSAAYWLTGSIALYSDALESTINVVAAMAAFIALRVASQPADSDHPYGHQKAEYFSAVFEGVLVVLAALSIFHSAYQGFLDPKPLDAPYAGLAINAGASVVNAIWAWLLLRWGREWRSPALIADGRHVMADVVTSVGVLIGVTLVAVTGKALLDPAMAALVALNILWSGSTMVRVASGGLMDQAAAPEMVAQIKELIGTHAQGAIEAHDVRTRHAGSMTFIDFHLVVPGHMSVGAAHDICDRIETALKTDVGGDAVVIIHVELDAKAKHSASSYSERIRPTPRVSRQGSRDGANLKDPFGTMTRPASAVKVTGSKAMPQIGHDPGPSCCVRRTRNIGRPTE